MKMEFEPMGKIAHIDDLGRIALPVDYRRKAKIRVGDSFEIYIDKKGNFFLKKIKNNT